jgi:malate dehydrogenase
MSIKVSLIGSGNIGGTLAHILASAGFCSQITLLDLNDGVAKGKSLDILQSSSIFHSATQIIGTSDYKDIENSDVIIITAGIARKPGMSRDDLLKTNSSIIASVAKNVKQYSPNSFVIIITNPLDAMVQHFQQVSGINSKKVVGMAGVLDSSRFKTFLSQALGVFQGDISCFVLGGHGDTMVPILSCISIGGLSLSHFVKNGSITQDQIDKIVQRTRDGGAEIVSLLGSGSAFYSPAESAVQMAKSYIFDQKRIMPCAAKLNGEYGVKDFYVGVPCIIGSRGVEKILELELTQSEKDMFAKSVESVKNLVSSIS